MCAQPPDTVVCRWGVRGPDPRVGVRRVEERRPAAMGFELLRAAEQFGAASAALVHAFGLGIGVLADERALGSRATQHVEFLRVEPSTPLVVAELQLWRGGSHASTLARGCGGVTQGGSIPSSKRFSALASR